MHKLLSDFEQNTGLICHGIDFSRVDFLGAIAPVLSGAKVNVSLP